VRNPELAETFARIAKLGADGFYKGAAAAALAAKVAARTPRAGAMTAADVSRYKARERKPVCGAYRAYRICGMGPPSSGATTVLAILKQLERFDLATLGSESPVAWHLFAESQRLAYADRERYLADSDFLPVPVTGLVDPGYLASRSELISPLATMASAPAGTPPGVAAAPVPGLEPQEAGTSHFVAVDKQGSVASYTSTVEAPFGSGLMFGGYYLNNELTDFSLAGAKDGQPVANRVEGGKRPRSSMAPTLVFAPEGRLVLALGAAGGATIPVQVARTIIGVIDWKLDAARAIALPMLFSPGDTVILEPGSSLEAMAPALGQLGHASIASKSMPLKTNAAQWNGAMWIGAADPRSEGAAITE
jgi:gamma-glutamyltranspeptidase/glutathione hydrolase